MSLPRLLRSTVVRILMRHYTGHVCKHEINCIQSVYALE